MGGGGCPRGAGTACEIKCDGEGACSASTLHALSSSVVLKCVGAGSCGGLTIENHGTNAFVLECLGGDSCMPAKSLNIIQPILFFGYCYAGEVQACAGLKEVYYPPHGHVFQELDCKDVLLLPSGQPLTS